MARKPSGLTVRSYNVGFGDCFLLTFNYETYSRHVLIDFGTMEKPDHSRGDLMKRIAKDIAEVTNGKLHVVVATHRHSDHISGFDGATGAIIKSLKPDVVFQPWTEDPDAATDARKAKRSTHRQAAMLGTLDSMQDFAQAAHRLKRTNDLPKALVDELRFIGEDNVKNKGAVKNLMQMGTTRRYVQEGDPARLGRILPGVKVHILGPPSLDQSEEIERYADKNEEEYWQLSAVGMSGIVSDEQPFSARQRTPRIYERWFARRLRDVYATNLLSLVRELDKVLNNTSLILLFETRGHKFLFSGDAQLENWKHALKKHKAKLRNVHLYKVGHHGSLNATPRSLWDLFDNKSSSDSQNRLVSLLSTKDGKHGHVENNTEVPRSTLVDALEESSEMLDTRKLEAGELCWEVSYDF